MNSAVPPSSDSPISTSPLTSAPSLTLHASQKEEEKPLVSWQKDMTNFFTTMGMDETKRCFDTELLVLSRYHQSQLPHALETLVEQLLNALEQHVNIKEKLFGDGSTDTNGLLYTKKRKRQERDEDHTENQNDDRDNDSDSDYQELAKRMDPEQVQIRASDSQVQQRINTYIQAKQHDVDVSNRTEFLNRPDPKGEDVTCARADAREINRNIQMKFDVVNNEDGPLARSVVSTAPEKQQQQQQQQQQDITTVTNTNNTRVAIEVMEERLGNLEAHLNVQFEQHATKPFTWTERISILETTLMDIEKKYPTWAAVHFNQPNRTYPPPPPITLITRPMSSLSSPSSSSTAPLPQSSSVSTDPSREKKPDFVASQVIPQQQPQQPQHTLKLMGRSNSSLTRAVLEQLERQKRLQSSSSSNKG